MKKQQMTTIAVSPVIRDYLNELRGQYSADEYLRAVLIYLKANAIDPLRQDLTPAQNKMSNCNDVMKRLEDVIKIIRSFEKNVKGMMGDATPSGEHAKTDSQLARENEQLKETLAKVREQLAEKEGEGDTVKATQLYDMTIQFLDDNPSRDGGVYVGKARTARFRDELTRAFHG